MYAIRILIYDISTYNNWIYLVTYLVATFTVKGLFLFFLSMQGMPLSVFQILHISKDHIMVSSNLDPRAAIKLLGWGEDVWFSKEVFTACPP